MNRRNILFIVVGIFLICTRFWISFGFINIDVSNDILGFLLIILGAKELRTRNSLFKKAFILSLSGFLAAALSQGLMLIDWNAAETTFMNIAIGLTVIFTIYFSYYFTEGMIMESRVQERLAVTRNYQLTWIILSALIFIHYIVFMSKTSMLSILLEAVIAIYSLYFCYTVLSSSAQLYDN